MLLNWFKLVMAVSDSQPLNVLSNETEAAVLPAGKVTPCSALQLRKALPNSEMLLNWSKLVMVVSESQPLNVPTNEMEAAVPSSGKSTFVRAVQFANRYAEPLLK